METNHVPVHLEYDSEANLYTAYVPDIPGCGEGETESAAIDDLKESLRAYIEVRGIEHAMSLIRRSVRVLDLDLTEVTRG